MAGEHVERRAGDGRRERLLGRGLHRVDLVPQKVEGALEFYHRLDVLPRCCAHQERELLVGVRGGVKAHCLLKGCSPSDDDDELREPHGLRTPGGGNTLGVRSNESHDGDGDSLDRGVVEIDVDVFDHVAELAGNVGSDGAFPALAGSAHRTLPRRIDEKEVDAEGERQPGLFGRECPTLVFRTCRLA